MTKRILKSLKETATAKPEAEDGADSADTGKRKAVSKRDYLDADGEPCDKIEEASGARYTLLGDGGASFDEQFGEPGAFTTMCGIFGFHTKIGNVANTVLNDKSDPGTPADAAEAISAFIESAKTDKVWAERTGGVGIQINKEALAGAVVDVAGKAGKTLDYSKVFEKLESDKAYLKLVRQVPAIAQAYIERTGKSVKSVDDAIAALG